MPTPEIYISTDVETDGPIPGPHSMLSLGSAAYTADKRLVSTFSANLETLEGASAQPKTAAWWTTQPEAWTTPLSKALCSATCFGRAGSRRPGSRILSEDGAKRELCPRCLGGMIRLAPQGAKGGRAWTRKRLR